MSIFDDIAHMRAERDAVFIPAEEYLQQPEVFESIEENHSTSSNELRPETLDDFVGQDRAKGMLKQFVAASINSGRTLPHILLTCGAGQGKTTLAMCVANDLGRRVFVEQAPISVQKLGQIGKQMSNGDLLLIDEIHLQSKGQTADNSPEVLYHIMEDKRLVTDQGMFTYPDITVVGCTTDQGLLPTPFIHRFTITPIIEPYSIDDMMDIASMNADSLGLCIDDDARAIFASASMKTPRIMNNFIKQASFLCEGEIGEESARMVLDNQNIELDGLTYNHMKYLNALLFCKRYSAKEERDVYKASLSTLTLSLGIDDQKFVKREIEPLLVRMGLITLGQGGRELTERGVERVSGKV